MTISEKAAYLRGLVEGQGHDPEAGEGKLWHVLSELVSDMAAALDKLDDRQEALADSLEEVEVGLDYLEEFLQDDYDYDDYDDEDEGPDNYYPFGSAEFRIEDDDLSDSDDPNVPLPDDE
jgi:hypothetical protein